MTQICFASILGNDINVTLFFLQVSAQITYIYNLTSSLSEILQTHVCLDIQPEWKKSYFEYDFTISKYLNHKLQKNFEINSKYQNFKITSKSQKCSSLVKKMCTKTSTLKLPSLMQQVLQSIHRDQRHLKRDCHGIKP